LNHQGLVVLVGDENRCPSMKWKLYPAGGPAKPVTEWEPSPEAFLILGRETAE
jgi:hypothetical protein